MKIASVISLLEWVILLIAKSTVTSTVQAGKMIFVEQKVGESLRLPCDVVAPPGDSVAVILWYRDHHPTAIYTYDARNESLGFQQHTPRGLELASRAIFYPKPPAALTINEARADDTGVYQCRVDFAHAPSRTTKIQAVAVTEVTGVELIRASPPIGDIHSLVLQRGVTATLHQPLRLLCKAYGGEPAPKIWWTINQHIVPAIRRSSSSSSNPQEKDRQKSLNAIRHNIKASEKMNKDSPLPERNVLLKQHSIFQDMQFIQYAPNNPYGDIKSYTDYRDNVTTSTLKIANITLNYEKAGLSCWVANSNSSRPLQSRLEVLVYSPPSKVELTNFPKAFVSGEPKPLSCRVSGSRPEPTIEWVLSKPGEPRLSLATQNLGDDQWNSYSSNSKYTTANSSSSQHYFSVRNSNHRDVWNIGELNVVLEDEDNGGNISCIAFNKYFPGDRMNDTGAVTVNYTPKVHLRLGAKLDTSRVKEGTSLIFTCDVDAKPPAEVVTWTHRNKTIEDKIHTDVLFSGMDLVLQSVTRNWIGDFQCKASNAVGSAVSNAINVDVHYAPVCSTKVKVTYLVKLGEFVSLSCKVEAKPSHVSFSWTFSTTLIQEELVREEWVRSKGLRSRLRYRPEKEHDYGTLRCWAQNSVGKQKEPCEYSVQPTPGPMPPSLNCSVTSQTWHSLNVNCEVKRENNSTSITRPRLSLDSEELKYQKELEAVLHGWDTNSFTTGMGQPEEGLDVPFFPDEEHTDILYMLSVEGLDSNMMVFQDNNSIGQFSVSGLTAGVDYLLNISAMTPLGLTKPVTLTALTLRAAENKINLNGGGLRSSSGTFGSIEGVTIAGIVIGCMAVAFLLIIPLIIMVIVRTRRKRRLEEAEAQISNKSTAENSEIMTNMMQTVRTSREAPDLITDDSCSRENLIISVTTNLPCEINDTTFQSTANPSSSINKNSLTQPVSQFGCNDYKLHHQRSPTGILGTLHCNESDLNYSTDDVRIIANRQAQISCAELEDEERQQIGAMATSFMPHHQSLNKGCGMSLSPDCGDDQIIGYANKFFTLPHKTNDDQTFVKYPPDDYDNLQNIKPSRRLITRTISGRQIHDCDQGSESRV